MSDRMPQVRTALVLAAGCGRRLDNDDPKPVFPVLGLPLLARTLFALEEAGITDAYVVIGYQGDRVREEIERLERLKVRVHWLHNDRWQEPNGHSVLAAEGVIEEPFILTMSDHVFEPAAVELLQKNSHRMGGIGLLIDRNTESINDLGDATKVRLEGDRIVEIGKSLAVYDAIDTGLFLASPLLFKAVREAIARGGSSLSDGVQCLAAAGEARVIDGTGRMWQDVDTPEDVAAAERKLLDQLGKETDGPIARYLNRPVSTALSRQLVKLPITPNQVSVATLVVGLAAAGLAAVGGYFPLLMAGLLFHVASILDGVDGEIANLTFRSSVKGEWVDTICDGISYVAFLVGLTVGVHRSNLPDFYFWMGVLASATAFLSLAKINLSLLMRGGSGSALSIRYGYEEGAGSLSRVLRRVHWLGKRDMFAFLTLLLALAGKLHFALPLFGILGTMLLLPAAIKVALSTFRRSERRPPVPRERPGRFEAPARTGRRQETAGASRTSSGV